MAPLMNLLAEWKMKSSRSPAIAAAASFRLLIPMPALLLSTARRVSNSNGCSRGDEEDEGAEGKLARRGTRGARGGHTQRKGGSLLSTLLAADEPFPPTARA